MKIINPVVENFLPETYVLPPIIQVLTDIFHLPHLVTETSVGTLEASSKKPDGTAWFGAGNSTDHYLKLFDHTSGIQFGLEDHYRTGDYVEPVKVGNDWVATMKAGLQDGTHNEQGSSTTRSGASFDINMNFGANGPHDGQFVLTINGHDLTLEHSGANWFFEDLNTHTIVQGLTPSPDGKVLTDSNNLAFDAAYLIHGTNPADIKPQDVHIALTEMVGTVGVAQVSEIIHLV